MISLVAFVAAIVVYLVQRAREERERDELDEDAILDTLPRDFLDRDVGEQFDIVAGLLPRRSEVPGVGRWVIYDFDHAAFESLTRGGQPELAVRMQQVFWDEPGPELAWVGGHIAEHGVRYDGLDDTQAGQLDVWVHAASAREGFWEELGMRGGAFLSQADLEALRTHEALVEYLEPLRWGRRVGGGLPVRDSHALLDPNETRALAKALERAPTESAGVTELREVVARAVHAGFGLYCVDEDGGPVLR